MRGMDLAYAIGKDPGYVTRMEHGTLKEIPPPETVKALSAALDLSETAIIEAIGYARPEPVQAVREAPADYSVADAFIASLSDEQKELFLRAYARGYQPQPGDIIEGGRIDPQRKVE